MTLSSGKKNIICSFDFLIESLTKIFNKDYFRYNFKIIIISALCMIFSTDCRTPQNTTTSVNKTTSDFYSNYSKKLGVELKGTEDKKFIETITTWIGTPYVYGGETKKGTDCSGMVQTIFKEVYNINLKRTAYDQVDDCSYVAKRNLRSRDLVFFKINNKKVSHVGIYITNNKFIHASLKGVIVSDLKDAYYAKYFYEGGRVKKLK